VGGLTGSNGTREWCSVLTSRWCLLASGRVAAGGFRKLVIQALNFRVLVGELLVGGEFVLRKLLRERGKFCSSAEVFACCCASAASLTCWLNAAVTTPVMFGAATGAGCFCAC
jgi:hypothetical protein